MSGVRWHLPAIMRTALAGEGLMVTACGKRGPIRPREDLGALPVSLGLTLFDEAPLVCEECCVAWDDAEARNRLVLWWARGDKREWRSHGAPLTKEQPLRWGVCAVCNGRESHVSDTEWSGHQRHSMVADGYPLAVVVRQ